MAKYIIEFIGTFFLVFTIALTGNPLAIGGVLTALIYMGYSTSGAQYNPATTIAVWIQKKINAKEAGLYILSQALGAAAASVAFHLLYGNTRVFFISPNIRLNVLKPLFVEGLFTFVLMMVILYTAVAKKTSGNQYFGLAIGIAVTGIGYAGSYISGGAYNPAVGVVPILVETLMGVCQCHPINHAWIYIVGPISGAAIAAILFRFVIKEEV